jgi:hypothetical protein
MAVGCGSPPDAFTGYGKGYAPNHVCGRRMFQYELVPAGRLELPTKGLRGPWCGRARIPALACRASAHVHMRAAVAMVLAVRLDVKSWPLREAVVR